MSKTLELYFDFTSPNVYLAYKALPALLDRTGADLKIHLALLGGIFNATGNIAPFFTFQKIKGRLQYEQLEIRRFVEAHGLTRFKWTPYFPHNTVLAMRGAIAADAQGDLPAYLDAGLAAVWEDGKDLSDRATFISVMDEAGLDGAALADAAATDACKTALRDTTDAAVARGVFGMPTFFVGDDMYFGKDRLDQVEAALLV